VLSACICASLPLTDVSSSPVDMEQNHRELHPTQGTDVSSSPVDMEQNHRELRPTRGNTAELRATLDQTHPQCVSVEQRDATTVLNGTLRLLDVGEAVCT